MEKQASIETRFLALFVFGLFALGTLATIAGTAFWLKTGEFVQNFGKTDFSAGAGLCFLAAALAYGAGAFSLVTALRR